MILGINLFGVNKEFKNKYIYCLSCAHLNLKFFFSKNSNFLFTEVFYIVQKEHHPYHHTADHHVLEHPPHFHHISDQEHHNSHDSHHPSFYRSAKLHQPPNKLNSFNFGNTTFYK